MIIAEEREEIELRFSDYLEGSLLEYHLDLEVEGGTYVDKILKKMIYIKSALEQESSVYQRYNKSLSDLKPFR